jgi:hypothetical protein
VEPRDDAHSDPPQPDIDSAGVDRSQIRAMLALTPEQRLNRVAQFIGSLRALRPVDDDPESC